MAEISRRTAIQLELAALILWMVVPNALGRGLGETALSVRSETLGDHAFLAFSRIGEIALVLFILWNSGDRWEAFGIRTFRWKRDLPLGLLVGVIAAGAWAIPFYVALGPPWTPVERVHPSAATLILACIAGIGLTVFHELLYRAHFVNRIGELAKNPWWGVLLAAALFAAATGNFGSILSLSSAFGTGLLCGSVLVLSRSLWPSLIGQLISYALAHFVFHFR